MRVPGRARHPRIAPARADAATSPVRMASAHPDGGCASQSTEIMDAALRDRLKRRPSDIAWVGLGRCGIGPIEAAMPWQDIALTLRGDDPGCRSRRPVSSDWARLRKAGFATRISVRFPHFQKCLRGENGGAGACSSEGATVGGCLALLGKVFSTEDARSGTGRHGGRLPLRLPGRHMISVALRGSRSFSVLKTCLLACSTIDARGARQPCPRRASNGAQGSLTGQHAGCCIMGFIVRRRPKISEPVLNSVIPAKAGTQVA